MAPWWTIIINQIANPLIDSISIASAAQTGKTFSAIVMSLWGLFATDSPVFIIAASEATATEIVDERMRAIIRVSPTLNEKIDNRGRKEKENRIFTSSADIKVGTANSAASLASVSARILFADECAKYSSGVNREGDPISLAKNRLLAYQGTSKAVFCSTPCLEDDVFWKNLQNGIVHHWVFTCENCKNQTRPHFDRLKFDKFASPKQIESGSSPITYQCEHCENAISESQYKKQVRSGVWIVAPGQDVGKSERQVSYLVPGLLSETMTFRYQVSEFLMGKDETLQGVINSIKGDPWGKQLPTIKIESLKEAINEVDEWCVPPHTLRIVAGMDMGGDGGIEPNAETGRSYHFYMTLLAILPAGRFHFMGIKKFDKWADALEFLGSQFMCTETQTFHSVHAVFLDHGYRQEVSYSLAMHQNNLFPSKGFARCQEPVKGTLINEYNSTSYNRRISLSKSILRYSLDTTYFKDLLWNSFENKTASIANLNEDTLAELVDHLTSEVKRGVKNKHGAISFVYQTKSRNRPKNHYLDCVVYALACAQSQGLFRYDTYSLWLQSGKHDEFSNGDAPEETSTPEPSPTYQQPPDNPYGYGRLY